MRRIAWVAAACLATLGLGLSRAAPANGRVDLVRGDFLVSVMPSLGGRVVALRVGKGPNLLDWDERREKKEAPPAALNTPFEPWNGRVVWVGPQSAWWTAQDLSPQRKAAKAGWPPDPFRETARYEVVSPGTTHLTMKGPASPVTGLEMSESVEIVGPSSVRFVTVAVNRRATTVSWDLWPNTRVRPEGSPYVRLASDRPPRIDGPSGGRAGTYPHPIIDGYLALPPGTRPKPPQEQLHVKAFVEPAEGEIAYFLGSQVLFLRAEPVPRERLHPEQAFVELYRGAGATADHDVLELEMHGPYVTLQPGEAMRFEQTAEIASYEGADDPAAHVAFLKKRAASR